MVVEQQMPIYAKVILTIACIAGLLLVSTYARLWEWAQPRLKKISIRQLGHAVILSIRKMPVMVRHSQEVYLTRPRAL